MPYATYTFAQLRQELANALNDSGKVFWTDGELKVHLWNSLRFWNALTGDNKQWYTLPVTGGATLWYDLQQIAGSPRLCTLLDTDLYSWLQYALIEAQSPLTAALSSGQFSTDQLVQSLQRARDEFLFRTGATSTVYSSAITPNVESLSLRETVIEVRRAYWLPAEVGGSYPAGATPFPLWRSDEFAVGAYQRYGVNSPGNPNVYSPGVEPSLTLTMTPPPAFPGALELLTVESQAALSNPPPPGTLLLLPNDFAPALYWRTLADLMDMNAECRDSDRAKYARSRFEQYCELIHSYPFILSGRVLGLPVMADAVENLDRYRPTWEVSSANHEIVGYSGSNLVVFPSAGPQDLALYVVANANLPVADADPVQLGREIMDAILGYAQHTATFKCGWAELSATMGLFKAIVQLAAKRNAKVRAMSTFRDLLYERATREDEQVPREEHTDAEAAEGVT
jgi:hypothetical protein